MSCNFMESKLLNIDAQSVKDRFKGLEMREQNDRNIYFEKPIAPMSICNISYNSQVCKFCLIIHFTILATCEQSYSRILSNLIFCDANMLCENCVIKIIETVLCTKNTL